MFNVLIVSALPLEFIVPVGQAINLGAKSTIIVCGVRVGEDLGCASRRLLVYYPVSLLSRIKVKAVKVKSTHFRLVFFNRGWLAVTLVNLYVSVIARWGCRCILHSQGQHRCQHYNYEQCCFFHFCLLLNFLFLLPSVFHHLSLRIDLTVNVPKPIFPQMENGLR